MAVKNFEDQLDEALALLPAVGQWMEFNEYKAKLYSANPQGGQPVFERMLKFDVVQKKLDVDTNGKPIVLLARKP